jgi:hypothetical protein
MFIAVILLVLFIIETKPAKHNYDPSAASRNYSAPSASRPPDTRQTLVPQPIIQHASSHNLTTREALAPFAINTSGKGYYFIKLVDIATGKDAFYVFVHAGIPAEVDVPLGRYELRYASGTTWYGMDHMFGYDTVYTKSSTTLEFGIEGQQYAGIAVTLYQVRHGNMHTQKIDKNSF